MAKLKDLPWIDFRKLTELVLGVLVLSALIYAIYWFFGILDKPVFVANVQGYTTGCTQALNKHGHIGPIFCGAKLENGDSTTFQSNSYVQTNQKIVFGHYKGSITGRDSYN